MSVLPKVMILNIAADRDSNRGVIVWTDMPELVKCRTAAIATAESEAAFVLRECYVYNHDGSYENFHLDLVNRIIRAEWPQKALAEKWLEKREENIAKWELISPYNVEFVPFDQAKIDAGEFTQCGNEFSHVMFRREL